MKKYKIALDKADKCSEESNCIDCKYNESCMNDESWYTTLNELVKKATPKKPLKNRYGYLVCPICANEVENERGNIYKYCSNCGQMIGNDEDEE